MEIRDLKTFLAVAETGSVTNAAALLGCSQPSVTRTIQELESQLGFALLIRTGRRVMLSEEGTAFEEEARRVIASIEGLAERTLSIAAGASRPIQVAATAAIATGLLPRALALYNPSRTVEEIRISNLLPNVVAQEVGAGRAEIGYSSMPLDVPGLQVLRLYAAQDVVALRRDDPLAKLDVIPLSAFSGRRMVTMLDPSRFQGRVANALRTAEIQPGPVIRVNVSYAALQFVRHTNAMAIIDPVAAYGIEFPEVAIRPLDTRLPFHWGAVAPAGRPLRPIVSELIEAVENTAMSIIPNLERLEPAQLSRLDSSSANSPQDVAVQTESKFT